VDTSLLIAIIALIGSIGGIITTLSTRRKTASEASEVITESAMKLVEPLNKRIDALEKLTTSQEKELDLLRPLPAQMKELKRGVRILTEQLKKNHFTPEWEIPAKFFEEAKA
jgi:hypothetical protein